jgi:uncharacterized DUF497 family protein
MDFRWVEWNVEHLDKHGVSPEEAEAAVSNAAAPFPLYRGDGRWLVWGRGAGGRYLQVVFVLDDEDTVFVIHARPLTQSEARRFRRRLR